MRDAIDVYAYEDAGNGCEEEEGPRCPDGEEQELSYVTTEAVVPGEC